MKLKKVRLLRSGKYPVYGITIPKDIGILFQETHFSIKHSGTTIIMESGCIVEYSKEEIENYKFEDCRV